MDIDYFVTLFANLGRILLVTTPFVIILIIMIRLIKK